LSDVIIEDNNIETDQLINSRLLIVLKNISLKCNLINDLSDSSPGYVNKENGD